MAKSSPLEAHRTNNAFIYGLHADTKFLNRLPSMKRPQVVESRGYSGLIENRESWQPLFEVAESAGG